MLAYGHAASSTVGGGEVMTRNRVHGTVDRGTFLRGAAALGIGAAAGSILARRVQAAKAPRTTREKVESLFMVSFAGTSAGAEILGLLHTHAIGGITLFSRNVQSPAQMRGMMTALQRASRYGLLIATDQEGGEVVRVTRGVPAYPSEASYGAIGSAQRVQHDAGVMATDLRAMGLTINLAPVVDVLANATSPIGTRSYGNNPHLAATLSSAAIKGYQSHGLAATAKHFIGLGHTSVDSHELLPTVPLTWAQLQGSDLISWHAAIAAGVSTILVAHVALPRIDSVPTRPASLSPEIITGRIRGTLGFKGVIMTDSLLMGALATPGPAQAAEEAFVAGADILLFATNHDFPTGVITDAINRVLAAVQAGRISMDRLNASVARIQALKAKYPSQV
jgi:beta-N-acetylhexosaminidase